MDIKKKLTSRKFWVAIIGFVTAILTAFGVDSLKLEHVVSIISASAILISYIIGEGLVDASSSKNNTSCDK